MEAKITLEKFMKLIKRTAGMRMGSSSAVEETTITRNNELIYQGTETLIYGNRIHRSAYLEHFYKIFVHDADLRRSIGRMIRVDVNLDAIVECESVFGDITDWEKMQSKVFCQVINKVRNLKLLQEVPNTEYLDLAAIYQLEFRDRKSYIYSARITKGMLGKMGIAVETLHEQALSNMKKRFPYKIEPLEDIILNQTAFDRKHIPEGNKMNLPVYVIQNRLEADGAAVILDKEPFEKRTDQVGANLIVFPTSVHEVMVVPETAVNISVLDLKTLLMQINIGCIKKEEQLSPHIYRYDREKGKMEIAA